MGSIGFNTSGQLQVNGIQRSFDVTTPYHLLNGNLSLANSVITNGFATTLYTGNGTTQSVNTGVDMTTQWGNSATETFGGLVWIKGRSGATNNYLVDTVRGATHDLYSNATTVDTTEATGLTSFGSTGFNIGALAGMNTNAATYVSWNFQTTHRRIGTTNHGKAFTEHYNPYTGFTIIKYEGSGLAGHEIPHHLGRKLGFWVSKNLTSTTYVNWHVGYDSITDGNILMLNTNTASSADVNNIKNGETSLKTNSAHEVLGLSGQQMIIYGWANSYFDEANTLIGNYEIGVYQGTGAAGNKVTTRGKPAWVMIKRLDSTGDWCTLDNQRGSNSGYGLFPNLSNAEYTTTDLVDFVSDGFIIKVDGATWSGGNTSGGQYLYMVVYDNDSGSGKSKYPRATDTSTLNLNATIPFANGVDSNGTKNSILVKNETVSGLTFTEGKNYIYAKKDGTYGVTNVEPQYITVKPRSNAVDTPNFYDVSTNTWYSTIGHGEKITNGTFANGATGWAVSGAVVTNEQLVITSTGSLSYGQQTITTEIGKSYTLQAMFAKSNDNLTLSIGTDSYVYSASANINITFVAQSTSTIVKFSTSTATAGSIVTIDNVSLFESIPVIDTVITESRNYLNAVVYADQNGQPTYVEQLPKTQYVDEIKANEFKGKNACTAWVNFDGTTTPPTIRGSYNVKAVIRTGTGMYDIYFEKEMGNADYSLGGSAYSYDLTMNVAYTHKVSVISRVSASTAYNDSKISVQIFGGKN